MKKNKNCIQYYLYKEGKRKYLPKSKRKIAQDLEQKTHDEKVLNLVVDRKKYIHQLMDSYQNSIYDIYEKSTPERKCLIQPLIENDNDFIDRWYKQNPSHQNSYEFENVIFTDKGEPVRLWREMSAVLV